MKKWQRNVLFAAVGMLARRNWGRKLLWAVAKQALQPKKRFFGRALALAPSTAEVALRRYTLWFLLPLWFAPGILDWWMHRRTNIEKTTGWKESILHSAMMTEVGIPILAGLLLEINAGVIGLMIAAYLIHTATAYLDVGYTAGRREIAPVEQHVHSFLEMLPSCAVSFVVCMHGDQFLALLGLGDEKPKFTLEWKRTPVSPAYIAALVSAILLFIALPYGEELTRCLRERARPELAAEAG